MATKKNTTKKTGDFASFDAYRQRALDLSLIKEKKINEEPFILSTEQGFKKDIELERPTLRVRLLAQEAMQHGMIIQLIQLVFSTHADTVLERLEDYERETGTNSDAVLLGIVVAYFEHFYGKGAMSDSFPKSLELIERYGPAIRFDFHRYLQIDLDDFFLGIRHWETFAELVDFLPVGGAYHAAMAQDDELAEILNDGASVDTRKRKKTHPSSHGWDYMRQDLADLKDLVNALIHVTAHSEEPIVPMLRPETAFTRWEKKKKRESTNWINDQLGLGPDQR